MGHPLFGWFTKRYAVTPAPLASEPAQTPSAHAQLELLSAAARSDRGQSGASKGRPYAYVEWRQWELASRRTGGIATQVVPSPYQSWLSRTGMRVVSARTPARAAGAGRTVPVSPAQDQRVATGRTSLSRLGFLAPVTPASVQRDFLNFLALSTRQPVGGRLAGKVLAFLSRLPGLTSAGGVIDRAGRPGVAISLYSTGISPAKIFTLVFRPSDGALLEEDTTVSAGSDQLHVRAGAVVGYALLLRSGWTTKIGARLERR